MSQSELPELQEHDQSAPEAKADSRPSPRSSRTSTSSHSGSQIKAARTAARATARTTVAVLEADQDTRAVAASLLGVKSKDVVDLVAVIVAPPAGARPSAVLADIRELSEVSDPMQRVLAFAGVDREKMRQMRQAMSGLGLVEGNTPSGSDVSMAVELSEAAGRLAEDERASVLLDRVLDLLG